MEGSCGKGINDDDHIRRGLVNDALDDFRRKDVDAVIKRLSYTISEALNMTFDEIRQ